jgi:hypothetical protein
MTNLKLQILDLQGLTIMDEIYGKTRIEEKSSDQNIFVNLTSLPEEGRTYFAKLLAWSVSSRNDQK